MSQVLATDPFLRNSLRLTLCSTARPRLGHMWCAWQCVRACACGGGVPPGAEGQIFLAATCHQPFPGASCPRGGCSVRDRPAVICQSVKQSGGGFCSSGSCPLPPG